MIFLRLEKYSHKYARYDDQQLCPPKRDPSYSYFTLTPIRSCIRFRIPNVSVGQVTVTGTTKDQVEDEGQDVGWWWVRFGPGFGLGSGSGSDLHWHYSAGPSQ